MDPLPEKLSGCSDVWNLACSLLDVAAQVSDPRDVAQPETDLAYLAHGYFRRHPAAIGADDHAVLADWLHDLAPRQLAQACRAVAEAIDDCCWTQFTDLWLPVGERRRLQSGDRLPIVDHPYPYGFDRASRAVRPGSLEVLPGDTEHIRRFRPGPGADHLAVVVDRSLDAPLQGALGHSLPLRIAAVVPNHSVREEIANFDIGFPIGPTDPERQAAHLRATLETLAKHPELAPPHLVVVPELAVTASIQHELCQVATRHGELAWMIVAGSRHEVREGFRRNTVALALPHRPRCDVYDKIHPATGEGIDPGDTITIFVTGQHRMAVVVCKDLMVPSLADILADMGVTIVAAPSMSEKTEPFLASCGRIAGRAQPFVVVANSPRVWPSDPPAGSPSSARDAAIFCQPIAGRAHVRHPDADEPKTAPATWRLQLGTERAVRLAAPETRY